MKLNRLNRLLLGSLAGISSLPSMATAQNLALDPVYVLEKAKLMRISNHTVKPVRQAAEVSAKMLCRIWIA
ncbi:putative outer membrane colicin Js receptor [Actinobacillus equuli]|nr:putative outer membrane colicin Js receptor [Actinobacillus equuli]